MSMQLLNFRDNKLIEHCFNTKNYEKLLAIANAAKKGDSLGSDFKLYEIIMEKLYSQKYEKVYHPLALFYIYSEKAKKKGFQILEAAAFNCVNSLKSLGDFYLLGFEVEEDLDKAIFYYEKAASLNDKEAAKALATIYYNEDSSSSSIKYKEQSLNENNIEDVKNLALDYLKMSSSTDKYYKRMVELFEKNAKRNDIDSLNILGHFYYKGEVVPQDFNKSLEYYKKSLLLGDSSVERDINLVKSKMQKQL